MLKTEFTKCTPSKFTIPTTFAQCLTYYDQIMYLYNHKQNTLIAGNNIKLTPNDDGTVTISASGEIKGEKYRIQSITPPEHYIAGYRLVTESGEIAGVDILIPDQTFDPSNIQIELDNLNSSLTNKQNKLTAGTNISIVGDVISNTYVYDDTTIKNNISAIQTELTENGKAIQANTDAIGVINDSVASINSSLTSKQNKLTAGSNISIVGDVISSTYIYDDTTIKSNITAIQAELAENGKAIQANTDAIGSINDSIASINSSLTNKQNKLTAGTNISIVGDVISSTYIYDDTELQTDVMNLQTEIATKQSKLTGEEGQFVGFDESGNPISTSIPSYSAGRGINIDSETIALADTAATIRNSGSVTITGIASSSYFTAGTSGTLASWYNEYVANTDWTGVTLHRTMRGQLFAELDVISDINIGAAQPLFDLQVNNSFTGPEFLGMGSLYVSGNSYPVYLTSIATGRTVRVYSVIDMSFIEGDKLNLTAFV